MKDLLFTVPLKPGMLNAYQEFSAENITSRKQEYAALLERYGLRSVKIWFQKLAEKEYVVILHEAEDDALERLSTWASSTHPFDLWYGAQLDKFYEIPAELAHSLIAFYEVKK